MTREAHLDEDTVTPMSGGRRTPDRSSSRHSAGRHSGGRHVNLQPLPQPSSRTSSMTVPTGAIRSPSLSMPTASPVRSSSIVMPTTATSGPKPPRRQRHLSPHESLLDITRRRSLQGTIFGGRVQPQNSSSAGGGFGDGAEMEFFPLRFVDPNLEEAFAKHFNQYVVTKVRLADVVTIVLNAILVAGHFWTCPMSMKFSLFASRVATIALSVVFLASSYLPWFHRRFKYIVFVHYILFVTLLVLPQLFVLIEFWSQPASMDDMHRDALFCSQQSARTMTCLYFVLLFYASGMRFTRAAMCTAYYFVLKLAFLVFVCPDCLVVQLESSHSVGVIVFCMISRYYGERQVRREFVKRLHVTEERQQRDDLLETMLPVHIKNSLKDNRTDDLAEYYDEISILFCYVSNFQELSKNASATELVQLVNRIVFCFDKATDACGVYKMEAIAETYMCAAGVPVRDPYHCEKIADMALTMLRIRDTELWSFNGVDIQIQIGINSGPVVAGVIGSKAYSYHLFGDTVNTSSRICSSGFPGKIQISERTKELLSRSGCYRTSERGMTVLKGKGAVRLFFLDGKIDQPRYESMDVARCLEASVDESVQAQATSSQGSSAEGDDLMGRLNAVTMSPWTLQFRSKAGVHARRSTTVFPGAPINVKALQETSSEMEAIFQVGHDKDSMPQFMTAWEASIGIHILTILMQYYYRRGHFEWRDYVRYGVNIAMVVSICFSYRWARDQPAIYTLKERYSTAGAVAFMLVANLQMFFLTGNHSTIGGASGALDLNVMLTISFGLAIHLRFRNSMIVAFWSLVIYIPCLLFSRTHTYPQMIENFVLYVAVMALTAHFSYRREVGLRLDFLLKCTLRVEKHKCETLLANMLPSSEYAEALMSHSTIVDELTDITLLYSDMVGFTALSATLKPGEICLLLNQIFSAFDRHLDDFGVYKMDTVGDAFIVIGGLPKHKSRRHHAAAVAAFAVEMQHEIEKFCEKQKVRVQMRIGIHTGKAVGGIIGIKKPRYLIWGRDTVVANLMESKGLPGRIQVSDAAHELLKDLPEFRMEERVGRIATGDAEPMRTFLMAPDQASVKNSVISRYLQPRREMNAVALEQLKSCLQLPENSPLAMQLGGPRPHPRMVKRHSFADIIAKGSNKQQ